MNTKLETIIGFLVIMVAIGFAAFSYKVSELKKDGFNTYKVVARFNQIEGITVGSDVRISGINVGSVLDMELDLKSYDAVVTMSIKNGIEVPEDSSAQVTTEGFLKNKHIAIYLGSSHEMLKDHGVIKFTQSSISLENLIGKLLYNFSK